MKYRPSIGLSVIAIAAIADVAFLGRTGFPTLGAMLAMLIWSTS